jgi:hypothetical protein
LDDVLQIAKSIKDDDNRSKALSRIAESQAKCGYFDAAV